METSIRRAVRTDAGAAATLWLQLLDEQAALDSRLNVAPDAGTRWLNDFNVWVADETRRIWLAEREGRPVGFLSAHRWAPPPVYGASEEVYIDELYVEAGVRNLGIGRALVEEARAWAEEVGAERMRVGVLTANADGLRFWSARSARPFATTLTIELASRPPKRPEPGRRLGF